MKKIVSIMLAAVMLFSLAACGDKNNGGASQTNAPGSTQKTVKVGVCIYKFDDNFMTVYRNELEKYINSKSNDQVKYDVTIVDGKGDQAEQTNQINNFIANKVDVLIVNLVQSSSAAAVIELVKAASIPTIFINREPTTEDMALWDKIAYVGADARQSGTFQGEIINELPDHGDLNGDGTVSYVMCVGDPENVDAQYRTEFSIKAVVDSGMKVEKLVEQRGDWAQEKGQEITASALAQYGNKVEVVFCNNDAMALGAVQAINAAGRTVGKDIYLVGVDALDEAVELVNNGGMTGTVLNDAVGQSHTAVDVAIKAVNGEALEKNYTVDYVKVVAAQTTTNSQPTTTEKKTVKVGVCIYKFDDNFMTVYRNELESYLKGLANDKVSYDVTIVDGKGDQAEQTNQINNFIANKVDVLIVNLVQSSSASAVIEIVKAAGIPTVFINREPSADDMKMWDKIAYVGADARQSGTFQGEIINELPDKGDLNGDGTISYVMVVGDPENVDAQYRTEFSIKAVEASGMKVEKLVEQRGDWAQEKGQEIVASALAQYGDKIEVVFCNNDAMALGAVQAISAAGRTVGKDIYLVGVDALEEAVALVNSGEMTGTVLNDAVGQSHTAVDVALKAVAGDALDKNYTVDYVKVVKK